MINNVTISQERYNDLKLKADLCERFKKVAEDASELAQHAQDLSRRVIEDNTRLAEENRMLKDMMQGMAAVEGLINSVEPKKVAILKSEKEEKAITNAEKYKDEIKWLEEACFGGHTGLGFSLAVLKDSGNPANCYDISCDDCAFCRFDDKSPYSMMGCSECREYWLQQPIDVKASDSDIPNEILKKADEEWGTFADFVCHNCDGCRMNKRPADKEDK